MPLRDREREDGLLGFPLFVFLFSIVVPLALLWDVLGKRSNLIYLVS